MRIAVDFDKTIVEDAFPAIGEPRKDALWGIQELHAMGHKLYLWTCREEQYLAEAIEWIQANGLGYCFQGYNENDPEMILAFGHDSRKLTVDLYLDDKQIPPLPSWKEIVETIRAMPEPVKASEEFPITF